MSADDFDDICREAESEFLSTALQPVISRVAITVLAGFQWAKNRNFARFYDKRCAEEDWRLAENELRELYSDKSIGELLQIMIDRQAEVIFLRRQADGGKDDASFIPRDRWEAKRYVAFLFFNDFVEKCVEETVCPEDTEFIKFPAILQLLKSLSIEDYCRISAYLSYRSRLDSGTYASSPDCSSDYYAAHDFLEQAFTNCKKRSKTCARRPLLFGGGIDRHQIAEAKARPTDRYGHIDLQRVADYVEICLS